MTVSYSLGSFKKLRWTGPEQRRRLRPGFRDRCYGQQQPLHCTLDLPCWIEPGNSRLVLWPTCPTASSSASSVTSIRRCRQRWSVPTAALQPVRSIRPTSTVTERRRPIPGTKLGSVRTQHSGVVHQQHHRELQRGVCQQSHGGWSDADWIRNVQSDRAAAVEGQLPRRCHSRLPDEVGLGWLRAFDFKVNWIGKKSLGDHILEFQPSVGFFNVFNFSNFDLPPNTLTGVVNGSAGSINGTNAANRIANRVGIGTGVYGLGAPRAIEFGLQISF